MRVVRKESAVWQSMLLYGLCLIALLPGAAIGQSTSTPASSPLTRQLHEAVGLAEHGDKQRAMALVLQMIDQNPKFVPAIKLKGMLLEETGKIAEAAAAYEEALKLALNDPDLLLKTGIYRLAAGDRTQAIKRLKRCTEILPGDGDAHYYLAQAYHLNGQDELALSAIRRSLKAEPENPSVWQKYGELLCGTGDCESALRWLLKAQHADATLPRIDFDIAATDYKLMDLAGTAEYAARAAEAQPKDFDAWRLLATADGKLARWQEAETAFQRILAVKADDVEALLGLGQCQVELKNYQTGAETLQSVLRLDPTRLLAHFYLSRAFSGMDKTADAEHEAALHQLMMEQATFVRSLSSDEHESPIKVQAQELLAAHREEDAVRLYQAHFKGTSASTADAYVFIGKLYLFMGKTEDGLRNLHHALKIQPTVRGAHTYEGILALKLGDLDRAENEFQAELANDPNYQTAIAELGEVRYHQGRWSDAAEQLAKSKTMTPELLYMLCDSYFHLGKVTEADLNAEAMAAYARNKPDVIRGLMDLLRRNGQSDLAGRLSADLTPANLAH
jgi:tetratricopeptide (TPR) repeat protein